MQQPASSLDHRRRRALFRATHCGTKELDWLVGRYAQATLPTISEADIGLLERFLVIPDPELHAWIMGAVRPDAGAFASLVEAIRTFHGLAGDMTGKTQEATP